jgi:nicotinate-nucleotide adenylyltransferase
MKYGLLGGTFDPPHLGHLAIAQAAIEELGLDAVILIPANQNPLKHRKAASPNHRLQMVRMLAEEDAQVAVSNVELSREGRSYTVDTLEELSIVQPAEYWLLMGTDTLKTLPKWKDPDRLLGFCRIGAIRREPDYLDSVLSSLSPSMASKVDVVSMKASPISSTQIRYETATGKNTDRWLTKDIQDYIEKHGLYREQEKPAS